MPKSRVSAHHQIQLKNVACADKMAAAGLRKREPAIRGEDTPIVLQRQRERGWRDVHTALAFRKREVVRSASADCFDLLAAVAEDAVGRAGRKRTEILVMDSVRSHGEAVCNELTDILL